MLWWIEVDLIMLRELCGGSSVSVDDVVVDGPDSLRSIFAINGV